MENTSKHGTEAHEAAYAPEGKGYLVQCPHGCNLGLSAHQPDEAGAQGRVELHRLVTEPLTVRKPLVPLEPDSLSLEAARARFTPGHPLSGSSTLDCGFPA